MKVLRNLLFAVLGLLAIVLIAGLIIPKETIVERSTDIEAPVSMVYESVNSLQDWQKWSPWEERDPDQQSEFSGEPGAIGSSYYWNGNDDVGEGTMTITEVEEGSSVSVNLEFVRPWPGEADAKIALAPNEDGSTKATWYFSSVSPYPYNVMNLFMNMDDMLGPDYEKGLGYLKNMVEGQIKGMPFGGHEVKVVNIEARHYLGVRETVAFADMDAFYGRVMPQVAAAMGQMGKMDDATSGSAYYTWDMENEQTDVFAGMFHADELTASEGLATYSVPAGKAAMIKYYGDYSGLGNAHGAIDSFFQATGLTPGEVALEDYVIGPGTETDTSKWFTRIIYPIGK
jgi:effector-binding domain-containing protein